MRLMKLLNSKAFGLGFLSWIPALIVLSMVIVINQPNLFDKNYYFCGILVFGIILSLMIPKEKPLLVPVVEYLLVFGVLYGKDLNVPVNTILLIYPLVEGIVFRGRFQSIAVLIVSCLIVTVVLTFPHPQLGLLIAELCLFCAIIFCGEEYKIREREAKIYQIIDRYYRSRNVTRKTHEVYHRIIKGWNELGSGIELRQISTYFLKNGNFFLINSSDYKWDRKLDISETLRKQVLTDDSAIWVIDVAELRELKRYLVPVSMDGKRYLVEYVAVRRNPDSLFSKLGSERVFRGLAGRIVNLVEFAHRLKERDASYFKETTEKRNYMEKAVGTMHFIRNRLNSIASLVEYGKMPEKEKASIPEEMVKRLFKSAGQDYEKIRMFANEMLDSSKFPYAYTEQQELKQEVAFIELAESVESQLQQYVSVRLEPRPNKRPLWVNETDLRVMMTDWISNMRKYGEDYEVEWEVQDKYVEIRFRNSAKAEDAENVFNSMRVASPKTWDTRKKTFGIMKMRELAAKNNILLDINVSDIDEDVAPGKRKLLAITIQIPLKHEQEDFGD
ncbi:MAG: hypothetical protein K2G67_00120 [Muribaculaceae bacterium]|nr:hypothetical protein [Muribaculaceae bacterium]